MCVGVGVGMGVGVCMCVGVWVYMRCCKSTTIPRSGQVTLLSVTSKLRTMICYCQ